ncbi:putative phloem protein [Helianthus anomalus]
MISVTECLDSASSKPDKGWRQYNSRFDVGTYRSRDGKFKTRVKTQFLSPGITYTVNFVFKFAAQEVGNCELIGLIYKLQGDAESSVSHLAYKREDGWWMAELYQFTSDHRIVDLEILFDGSLHCIEAEGIEFLPLEKVEHKDGKQPISDSDANWEQKLPVDYENIMKRSKNSVQYATKKEAYEIMRKGFLVTYDKRSIWFSLDKNGKKCHMLSARASSISAGTYPEWLSFPESRFGEAIHSCNNGCSFNTSVQYQLLSSNTTYASYLVYKLPKNQTRFEAPVRVYDNLCRSGDATRYIYLSSPQTPVIRQKADQNTHNPPNTCMTKGLPQQRNDGWMEVQIWEFEITANATNVIPMDLSLRNYGDNWLTGMIIEGLEFRPI